MTSLKHLERFRPSELGIADFGHWIVTVRPKQVTLGSCVILLKREEASLGELTTAEAAGLVQAAKWFEAATKTEFSAEKFNYIAAMMKDPFVHFHAFPRYSAERDAVGQTWKDEFWPKAVSLTDVDTSDDVLRQLVSTLRKA